MAHKRIGNNMYVADTFEDLKLIKETDIGASCEVIKEAAKYKLMSTGEWIKQTNNTPAAEDGNDIDVSNFVTKKDLEDAVDSIEIPSIEGLATEVYVNEATAKIAEAPALKMFEEDPVIMASNPGSKFGIALNNGDSRTLPEAMLEKGVGMYNFWVHKSNTSLPEKAIEKQSSCRGLCCVDTVKETGWYGWIILFDHDGEMYTQYIRNSEPKGWR